MADEQQVNVIKQGAEAWSNWRNNSDSSYLKIDLSGIDLSNHPPFKNYHYKGTIAAPSSYPSSVTLIGIDFFRADLGGSNLSDLHMEKANLYLADLTAANLSGAWLQNAHGTSADFSHATLEKAFLTSAEFHAAKFTGAKLKRANLRNANLVNCDFRGADLSYALLDGAKLSGTDFTDADLTGAELSRTNLNGAVLKNANLTSANIRNASLVSTDIEGAHFSDSLIYGISVWDLKGQPNDQSNLVITPDETATITVDDLEVAQFIYLLLNNAKIKTIIDVITSKAVLILGRFTEERKAILDAIREELRKLNFTPILFDFDKPVSKDVTGTVETLARMARFIIADLTDPSSIPHEMATIIPFLRTTPVLPIRLQGTGGYTMFDDFKVYPWVLERHEYKDCKSLIAALPQVIAPANHKAEALRNSL